MRCHCPLCSKILFGRMFDCSLLEVQMLVTVNHVSVQAFRPWSIGMTAHQAWHAICVVKGIQTLSTIRS